MRTNRSHLLVSRLQNQKAKLNALGAACDFLDDFTFPVLCDHHVSILKFYLSALPSPPPVSSEHNLFVSILALLPATTGEQNLRTAGAVGPAGWCRIPEAQYSSCCLHGEPSLMVCAVCYEGSSGSPGSCLYRGSGFPGISE
jgi:hypothetical protein